jgi:hypothetical protein
LVKCAKKGDFLPLGSSAETRHCWMCACGCVSICSHECEIKMS